VAASRRGQARVLRNGLRAAGAIRNNFADRIVPGPSADEFGEWLARMAGLGVAGGAIYDALVAESARRADLELVTFDRRARSIYDRVGVRYRYVDPD
jgi:hypothetical protein